MTQQEYIDILFDDLGFNLTQRKDFLWLRYGVKYSDELDTRAKSLLIDDLKSRKKQ